MRLGLLSCVLWTIHFLLGLKPQQRKSQKKLYGTEREAKIEAQKGRKPLVFEKHSAEASFIRQEGIIYESGLFYKFF